MAERTLTVGLRAVAGNYLKTFGNASAATKRLQADLRKLERSGDPLAKPLARLSRVGSTMSRVGSTLTRRVSLPLAAVGAVAVKMALDFDTSMTKVATLTAASSEEVAGMRDRVLDLAGETAQSPKALADGLFVAASATGDAATAMDILERSARAAALGMGDTETIARAAASVVNAYGREGVDAARAVDVLVATAQAGNFSVDQLAGSLGRVLPFARSAGVSLEDVGGAVALLTRTTGDANSAITQTAGLFRVFVGPTKMTIDALSELGLTAEDLRNSFAEKGLVATLTNLEDRLVETTGSTGAAREALRNIIPDSQAFAAAIEILDADTASLNATFGTTADSSKSLDEAFLILQESSAFKTKQAFAELQTTMVELGAALLPVVEQIAAVASKIAEAFQGLPEGAQQAIVWVGLVAAALGPVLKLGGAVSTTFAGMAASMAATGGASSFAAAGLTAAGTAMKGLTIATVVAAGVIVLAEAWDALFGKGKEFDETRLAENLLDIADAAHIAGGPVKETTDALVELMGQGVSTADVMDAMGGNVEGLAESLGILTDPGGTDQARHAFGDIRRGINEVDDALVSLVEGGATGRAEDAFKAIVEQLEDLGFTRGEITRLFDDYGAALEDADVQSRITNSATEELTNGLGLVDPATGEAAEGFAGLTEATEESESAIESYLDTLRGMFDPLFGLASALRDNEDAQLAVTDAWRELRKARREHGEDSREAADAERELADANLQAGESALGVIEATGALNDAIAENPALIDDAIAMLGQWREAGLLTEAAADMLEAQLLDTAFAGAVVDDSDPNIAVSETGNRRVQEELSRSRFKGEQLDRTQPNVRTSESGNRGVRGELDSTRARASRLDRTQPDVRVSTSGHGTATSNLRAVAEAVHSIPLFRNVRINVESTGQVGMPGRGLGTRQHGGPFGAGQLLMVGEAGPELAVFDSPGRILPNHDSLTRAALAGARPAQSITMGGGVSRVDVGLHITGDGGLADAIHTGLRVGKIQMSVNGQRVKAGR